MNTNNDPMEDIREIRHQISNEFGHNPKSYIDYLKSTEKNYATQLRLYEKSSDIKHDPCNLIGLSKGAP